MATGSPLKTLCLGILLISAVESGRVRRQAANGQCQDLPPPKNGQIKCNDDGFDYVCTATCNAQYQFTTKATSVNRACDQMDGTWYDGKDIPECQPECAPICQNGGSCVEPDKCACVDGWRGDHCQHHASLCNSPPGPKYGNIQCSTDSAATTCTVACAPTFHFKSAPAKEYKCTADGTWTPPKDSIPDCEPGSAVQPTGSTVHQSVEATCVAWSQDHYRTFDNKIFTFKGKCTYLLAKDCSPLNAFDIHVINDANCKAGEQCRRELDIYIGKSTISLRSGTSGPEVTWNTEKVVIPGSRDGVTFEKVGSYTRVSSSQGFRVKWDGKESIFVQISDDLKGKTCGLCGRYDGDATNDFETDAGKVVTSVSSFGNSWKRTSLDAATCPDLPQQMTCQNTAAATTRCNQLLSDAAFTSCHTEVDPTPYIDACKADCCSTTSDSCSCNTFEAYSRQCMEKKVKLSWRKTDRCPVSCDGGRIFKECGSACQKRCQDATATCSDETCVDGCFCPDGTVLHDGQCITADSCPCENNGKDYTQGQTIPKDCNTCTCKSGKWDCTTKKCEATCSATGDPHYKTFDGARFNFMGTCSYYLIQDPNFDVIVDNIKCGHGEASCTKSVTLDFNGYNIKLDHNHQLFVNGKEISRLPYTAHGIKIFMVSSLFMQAELSNGIKILWDGRTRAYITAPASFMQKTKGLCGFFDGNQNNDFLTKEGDIETNTNAFGNRWKTVATCRDMPITPQIHPCDQNIQRKATAEKECAQLKGDVFKACHGVVDVDEFYENCRYDTCACTDNLKDCMCPNFGEYADTCAVKGITINWRLEITECALQCEGGQEYQVCGSPCARTCRNIAEHEACQERCVEGCNCPKGQTLNDDGQCVLIGECPCMFDGKEYPAGYTTIKGTELCACTGAKWVCQSLLTKNGHTVIPTDKPIQSLCVDNKVYTECVSTCPVTCDNVHDPPTCTTTECEAGCVCKPGFVKEGDTCVEANKCPCHHGGKAFSENDKIVMDCNECTCKSRKWECEMKDCPAICSTYGDSHYKTFDGKPYEFQGNCDYILAKSTASNSVKFQITTENIPCGTSGVTCTKAIEFTVGEPGEANFYRLNLVRGKPIFNEPGSPFHISEVGNFIYINTTFGITMQWDKGTTAYIRLSTPHRNKVVGLCGNFNGDQKDDFQMPQGGPPAVKATTFGDSWKLHDYCAASTLITDTCEKAPHRKPWAQRKCGVMQSDLFEPCHHVVPYQSFMDKCIFDACACDLGGDCECLCTAIAAYAHECALQGVPIHWRSNELCAIECTDCSAYNPCISTCPKKTCDNRLIYDEATKDCKQDLCFEGCDVQPCPPGQVFDSSVFPMVCIPEPFCNTTACVLNGQEYKEGERITDSSICRSECEVCTCTSGILKRMGYCSGSTPYVAVPTASPPAHQSGSPTAVPPMGLSTAMPPVCLTTGWTSWMSYSTPTHANLGDIESIIGLRNVYSFCDHSMMTAIECRVIGQNTNSEHSGQKVTCDLKEGLKCYHKDQSSGLCLDYEVRFNCDCSKVPTAGPQTGVSGSPTASPPNGQSGNPTASPYVHGSGNPTASPPNGQSGNPTVGPQVDASGNPTASPPNGQSGNPTASPPNGQSGNPSATPPNGQSGNPTASPYVHGSGNPTASPSNGQSGNPTVGPQVDASGNPTASPPNGQSGNPTASPPNGQSGNPSATPPNGQSGNPTASPYVHGSGNPTASPSNGQSGNPTVGPQVDASGNPTASPPNGQSGNPTASPPNGQSGNPSASPPNGQSGNPTASPYVHGSGNPTASPSNGQSGNPTVGPQVDASGNPTASPPNGQSGNPSASPPNGQTGNPTASPYVHGSGNPTASPSNGQSGNPTVGPNVHGSGNPTASPPNGQSGNPTAGPDVHGSGNPTASPPNGQSGNPTASPYVHGSGNPTASPPNGQSGNPTVMTKMPYSCKHGWSSWMNVDRPAISHSFEIGGLGDHEDLDALRYFYSFCAQPSSIQCRSATNGETYHLTGDKDTECGIKKGFACVNSKQGNGICDDYEISVFCDCGGSPTAKPTPKPTFAPLLHPHAPGKPFSPVPSCMWTPWMNSFTKTSGKDGDYETISNLRLKYPFCEKPAAIECRTTPTTEHPEGIPYLSSGGMGVSCNLNRGLVCVDSMQPTGKTCLDYEVRVYCTDACPSTEAPKTTPTVEPPKSETGFPTAKPQVDASGNPTASPPNGQSGNPTAGPQVDASGNPTASPPNGQSGNPTAGPQVDASGNPTASPPNGQSGNPTAGPQVDASGNPTASPPNGQSGNPTAGPQVDASGNPTASPPNGQSGNPTAGPQVDASGNPTASPPNGQSGNPTAGPQVDASGNPTASPPNGQSGNPTAGPDVHGSGNPTASPPNGQSGNPTAGPYAHGSGNPTASPPNGQSGNPTAGPDVDASGNPTASPPNGQSGNPTAGPDVHGSGNPTAFPPNGQSGNPTAGPYAHGSGNPTASPPNGQSGNPTAGPQVGPSGNPTVSPPNGASGMPSLEYCREGWTAWVNTDKPSSGNGDIETVSGISGYPKTCMQVLAAECRVAGSKADYKSTGQQVTCDKSGVECINGNGQQCVDYEVRFYCFCGEQTTVSPQIGASGQPTASPPNGATGQPTASPPNGASGQPTASPPNGATGQPGMILCNHGWTPLMNEAKPSDHDGEMETIDKLRQFNKFCDESNIIAIECVVAGTDTTHDKTGQQVTCDKNAGLICFNSQQSNQQCLDYAVRFFCDCAQSTPYNPVVTTYGVQKGSNTATPPKVMITTGVPTLSPIAGVSGNPTAGPHVDASGNPTASPSNGQSGNPTAGPDVHGSGNPTASPPNGQSGNPTASPPNGQSGNPSASPPNGQSGNPTAGPHVDASGNPTASPPNGQSGNPTASPPNGQSGNPTAGPYVQGSGNPTAIPPNGQSGSPTASPPNGQSGHPTAGPHVDASGNPTVSPPNGQSGNPTASPPNGQSGNPTAGPNAHGSGNPTAIPPNGQSGNPTAGPYVHGSGNPTASPPNGQSGNPTVGPHVDASGNPTASPPNGQSGNPTASPPNGQSGNPTAVPPETTTCVSYWSNWFNQDKPTIGGGDYEHIGPDQLKSKHGFCSNGQITQIQCFGLKSQAFSGMTGETTKCDLMTGFSCNNVDNKPNCQDYQIRYFCQLCAPSTSSGLPTAKPSSGTGGNPTAGPGIQYTGNPTASPVGGVTGRPTASPNGMSGKPTPAPGHGVDHSPVPVGHTEHAPVTKTTAVYTWTTTDSVFTVSKQVCEIPMGTGNTGLFGKDQFTASSSFDFSFEAHRGRLNTVTEGNLGGAWMPRKSDMNQWIQVDLKHPEFITGVVTQGRPDMDHWVTKYAVSTSIDGVQFVPYTESGQTTPAMFTGNTDRNTQVKGLFDHEILARYVRIHPLDWYAMIALRFDVLSCTGLTSGPVTNKPLPGQSGVPTAGPVNGGSGQPTASPPNGPSGNPTAGPQVDASGNPTASPPNGQSGNPSASPPNGQTGNPTASPYVHGSGNPTASPPNGQSGNPTTGPHVDASGNPTASPPNGQSGNPSASPPNGQTGNPTASPYVHGSGNPTASPPNGQSGNPTTGPHVDASGNPTASPPNGQSGNPSASPPNGQTGNPTASPYVHGSGNPTASPPNGQSGNPTVGPHVDASGNPTASPPNGQSGNPSASPPNGQTGNPTAGPHVDASGNPTASPPNGQTGNPTASPPNGHSGNPTAGPHVDASGNPTASPPNGQSGNPSASPPNGQTGNPTASPPNGQSGQPTLAPGAVCSLPMGVDNAVTIKDNQLTSSGFSESRYTAPAGRLYNEFGAWSPKVDNGEQWIMVDFLKPQIINGILTQGSPITDKWVGKFIVSYSIDGFHFSPIIDAATGKSKIFGGNSDRNTVMKNIFPETLGAQYIRISPVEWAPAGIAMRFGILGCYKPLTQTSAPPTGKTVAPPFMTTAGVPMATPPSISTLEPVCTQPMGVENYRIVSGSQLTSSSKQDKEHEATNGRISQGTTEFAGAWVPSPTDTTPWIQVNFLEPKTISGVLTQGSGKDKSWIEEYKLSYSFDGKTFTPYTDKPGTAAKLFTGNTDSTTIVPNLFNRNVYAQYVRITPVSSHGLMALRFNILGCNPSPVNQMIPTTQAPGFVSGGQPTAKPLPAYCNTWTTWINTDNPSTGEGDFEKITGDQTKQMCGMGTLTKIECMTTESIPSYSSGELMTCDLPSGSSCKNSDNFPMPCSDYKIRYYCSCPLPTASPGSQASGEPTAKPPTGQSGSPTASPGSQGSGQPTASPKTGPNGSPTLGPHPGQTGQPTANPPHGQSGEPTIVPPFMTTPTVCLIPMGIESFYAVRDNQLSASSFVDSKHSAAQGRIFNMHGSWSPKSLDKPWIQVDFLKPTLLSGVLTQGSPDANTWVTKYKVYFGFNGKDFTPYTNMPGETTPVIFGGNSDKTTPVRNLFNRDITAQYIRIYPTEWSSNGIGMRFNLLGCTPPTVLPPTSSPLNPTAGPQLGASGNPTASPPNGQSGNPTVGPNVHGSGNPTASPPNGQSGNPTASPPNGQSGNPTASPPNGQSGNPTAGPHIDASGNPTASPPNGQSGNPTASPPNGQSGNPTAVPPQGQSTPAFYTKCDLPMGIQNPGIIGGRQLSASSQLNEYTGAERARPFTQKDGFFAGSWLPKHNDKKQWIQVDFGASYRIAGVSTQGTAGGGTWVTKYEVYFSNDGHNFNPIFLSPTDTIPRIFEGNLDQITPVMNVFPEINARFIRIRPVEWNEGIGLRFDVFGCQMPSPTPSLETITKMPTASPPGGQTGHPTAKPPTGYSGSPTASPPAGQSGGPTASPPGGFSGNPTAGPTTSSCMYWTPWVTSNKPDISGEVETFWDLMGVVKVCEGKYVQKMECRTVGSKTPFDQTGEEGVTCNVGDKSLICMNSAQTGGKTCSDYEVRFFCDECGKPTLAPYGSHSGLPTAAPAQCNNEWSAWINRNTPDAIGETETVSKGDLEAHCPGGTVAEVECDTVGDSMAYYMTGDMLTCDAQTGLSCKHAENAPLRCHDYKIRFKCKCESVPTASPSGGNGQLPTAAPGSTCTVSGWTTWINTDKPSLGGGDYEKITPEQQHQYCNGGTLTKIECMTDTGINYYSTGEIMTCTVAGGSVCNTNDNAPVPCSDYKIRYYCDCPAPTAAPSTGAGGNPTVGPIAGHSGQPTAAPGTTSCTTTQWTPWVNNDKPSTGTGDHETLTPQQMAQYCAGGRLSKVECRTSAGIPYYSSGEIMTCDLANGALCKNSDNFPMPCTDYEVRYYCVCPEPTAKPNPDHSGLPTASPSSSNGGNPTAGPLATCTTSKWSSWINRDNPNTGEGDFESMTQQEITKFCAGGEISEVKCETVDGIPSYSSGELITCDKQQGLVCKNVDNFPVTCSDYRIQYFCKCSPTVPHAGGSTIKPIPGQSGHPTASPGLTQTGGPTASPHLGQSGGPTAKPIPGQGGNPTASPVVGQTGGPTAAPVITTCSQSHFSQWVNRDLPDTGNGDHESMTPTELAAFCKGGKVTKVECYTGDIPSYSSGELITCDLKNGLVCNNADNYPVECSDYKIRYFCDCSGSPIPHTTTAPEKKFGVHCDWSQWINTGTPESGNGDMETIESIKTKHGVCKNMQKIECRIAGTNTMSTASGQSRVTCDVNNGLRCFNDEQLSKKCYDYEVRVLCWDNTCTGTMPTAGPTEAPYKNPTASPGFSHGVTEVPLERTTTAVCAPGQKWHACAFTCDEVCHATSGFNCDGATPHQCVPGCKEENLTGPKCANGLKLSYTGQCVKADMCPCKKPDGTIAQPFEIYNHPVLPCTKCHCFNNTDSCTQDEHCVPTSGPTAAPVSHPTCDWTNWINVDKPSTGDGDVESILKIRSSHRFCAHPVNIECREAATQKASSDFGQKVSCDLVNGFRCFSWENGGSCSDYEVRFYCPCAPTASPGSHASGLPTSSPPIGNSGAPTDHPYLAGTGNPTASPPNGVSGHPTAAPVFCGWSAWTNSDHPNVIDTNKPFEGDIESIASLMTKTKVCTHDMMKMVECRVASTKQMASSTGQVVTCDTMRGLRCDNAKQGANVKCLDYEMRVYCDCSSLPTASPGGVGPGGLPTASPPNGGQTGQPTVAPHSGQPGHPTASPPGGSQTGNPTASPPGSYTGMPTASPPGSHSGMPTAAPNSCGWTTWMNSQKPDITGEMELLPNLRNNYSFCKTEDITAIECRNSLSHASVAESGQVDVICDLKYSGLMCMNNKQAAAGGKCYDYEVRVLCEPKGVDCTKSPTASPVVGGSGQPTSKPNVGPNGNPTASPVVGGSGQPTSKPNVGPNGNPTASPPNGQQTGQPTASPVGVTGSPTAQPPQMTTCASYWSVWINTDKPETGGGDFEHVGPAELASKYGFCKGGDVTKIECYGADMDAAYYSTGDVNACDLKAGLSCKNSDNAPMPCQDYKIRYFCEACTPVLTATSSVAPNKGHTDSIGIPTTPIIVCPNPMTNTAAIQVPDHYLTASSSLSAYSGPQQSKLDAVAGNLYSGAWIPKTMDKGQWIEARFEHPEYVNAIVTKGREGANQWVKSFMVAYSLDGQTFNYYEVTPGTPAIFNGNFDGQTEVRTRLTPIVAKYIRIQPLSWEGAIALRFSIIGCRAPETVLPTAAPSVGPNGNPTAAPGQTGSGQPTAAPQQTCLTSTWSKWVNRNTNPDGDFESMTKEELAKFCPVGKMDKVECETVDNIPSYSTGEVMECTSAKGLVCNNADNFPMPCSDYRIRYHCDCSGVPTASPGKTGSGLPTSSPSLSGSGNPTASPGQTGSGQPTAAPQQTCLTSTWSKWVNRNTNPDGDFESMTKEELAKFCPVGKMDKVECETVDNIPSYSTGEVMECTSAKGLVCNNADNFPMPCSDYRIRYHCDCSGVPTPAPGQTGSGLPTASPSGVHPGGPTASPVKLTAMPTPNIPSGCKEEMGMKNGYIRNDMISASSYRDGRHTPAVGRLGLGGSWISATVDQSQYVQVNFLAPRIITGFITQGRPDAPSYVTSYKVFFSYDGTNWNPYREVKGQDKVFSGNFDNNTPVTNSFLTPMRAQYIRINPQTWKGLIAMRFEVLGCFENYPTVAPPHSNPLGPTASPGYLPGQLPTAKPPNTQTIAPELQHGCVIWDKWVDLGHVTLTSNGDREPIEEVKKASGACAQPMAIECRTATPDHTKHSETGQKVSCNLWEGLTCMNSDQKEPMCFNYEVRLGCIKQSQECLAIAPTAVPSVNPPLYPTYSPNLIPCYIGMDLGRCPQDGCQTGFFCDGLKCVQKSECPCVIDGQVVLPGQIKQNSNCDTCQCVSGEVKCLPMTCPPCAGELSTTLDKKTCQCECQSCATHEFSCGSGQCIPLGAKCDGVTDCTTDEFECMSTPVFTIPGTPTPKPTRPGLATPTAIPDMSSMDPRRPTNSPVAYTGGPTPKNNDLFTSSIKVVTTGMTPGSTDKMPPHGITPSACAQVQCAPLVPPPLKHGEVAQIIKTTDGCCEEYLVVCEPQKCPAISLDCMKPEVLTRSVEGDRCCPEYTCVCPPKCPVPTEPPCTYGSQVVEIVIGCNCTTKACVAGTPSPLLVTTTYTPPVCSYTMTKTITNGKEVDLTTSTEVTHGLGETWTDGLCKTCQCVNKTSGTTETSCKEEHCPACQLGEERKAKAGSCCGDCVKTGCVSGGKLYKAGEKIASSQKCFERMCTMDLLNGDFMLQTTQVQCETVDKLPKCTGNENKYDDNGCCLRCVPSELLPTNSSSVCQSCTPRLMFGQPQHSVGFFKVKDNGADCANQDPVLDLKECSGYCGSSSRYTEVMKGFNNNCQCCQPANTVSKTVQLVCSDGRKISKTYTVPETCGCSACAGGA